MPLASGPNMQLLTYGAPGEAHYLELMRQWRGIDFWLQPRVTNQTTTAPPGSPSNGDAYIIGLSPTGAWGGRQGQIARWTTDLSTPAWEYFIPRPGWSVFVTAEALQYTYTPGSAWSATGDGGATRTPLKVSAVSSATITPTFLEDIFMLTAQAAALNIANPTGTPIDGLGVALRIKDNGTARAITWSTQYRGIGMALPSTTVANKTMYVGMIWNATDSKFDVTSAVSES